MKSSQQKKLSLLTPKRLPVGFIAAAVASLGMMGPVLSQQAPAPPPVPAQQPAPPPPGGAAQVTSTRGTVSQYLMNPDGLVDGLLLSDNTIVLSSAHESTVSPGCQTSRFRSGGRIFGVPGHDSRHHNYQC